MSKLHFLASILSLLKETVSGRKYQHTLTSVLTQRLLEKNAVTRILFGLIIGLIFHTGRANQMEFNFSLFLQT